MSGPASRGLTVVWGVLVLATVVNVGAVGFLAHPVAVVTAIFAVAAFKVHLILRHFMELKHGPAALRLYFAAWAAGSALLIVAVYAWPPPPGTEATSHSTIGNSP